MAVEQEQTVPHSHVTLASLASRAKACVGSPRRSNAARSTVSSALKKVNGGASFECKNHVGKPDRSGSSPSGLRMQHASGCESVGHPGYQTAAPGNTNPAHSKSAVRHPSGCETVGVPRDTSIPRSGAQHPSTRKSVSPARCETMSARAAKPAVQKSRGHHPSGCQSVNVPCRPPLVSCPPPPSARSSRKGSLDSKSCEAIAELVQLGTESSEVQQPSGIESCSFESDNTLMEEKSEKGSCPEADAEASAEAIVKRRPMQRRRPSLPLSLPDENVEPEVSMQTSTARKDTPRSLTESALLKSQLLLDELEQLGLLEDLESSDLVDASPSKQMCESDMSTSASMSDCENSNISECSSMEQGKKLDIVQVPAELLEMLTSMWQELQHLRSKDENIAHASLEADLASSRPLPEKRFDSWPLPNQSLMSASPRDSLFPTSPGTLSTMTPRDSIMSSSPDAGSSLNGSIKSCSSNTRSVGSSCLTSCSTLSEEDKNLLKELRDLLRSGKPSGVGLPSQLSAALPIQRSAVQKRICIPLSARSVPVHVVKTTVKSSPLLLQRQPAVQAAPAAQAPTRFVHPRRSVLV